MKVEDIKLAFETNLKFLNNISELKTLEKNLQTEYNNLSGGFNLVAELQKFEVRANKILTNFATAEGELLKFIGVFKNLGVDAPKEVSESLENVRRGKVLVNKQRDLIMSAAKGI